MDYRSGQSVAMDLKTEIAAEVQDIDLVLDFIVSLSQRMIVSGANLERVHLAIEQICHYYDIRDVSIYLLSSHVSVSGRNSRGLYRSRQMNIPAAGIHLGRLKRLNRLSYSICREIPQPDQLMPRFEKIPLHTSSTPLSFP